MMRGREHVVESTGAQQTGAKFLVVAASLVILVAGLKAAAGLLVPFLISLFLALISLPLMNWLQAHRVPSGIAALLTILADVFVLLALALAVGGSIQGFTEAVPRYQARLQELAVSGVAWLRAQGIDISPEATRDLFDPGIALDLVTRTLRGAAAVLSNLLLVFLTIVFILFEAAGFPHKLEVAFGRHARGSERFATIRREVQRYLAIKTLVSLATGLIVGIAVWLIGVDFPLLWGLLAFAMNYIPALGSILAAVPPVLLALVKFGPGRAMIVALVFLSVNVLLGNLLEPQLMGRRLGLSTLVVFLSLVFWGWVWGPVGMLLSVPLTMIVKIMLENTEDLRWIAVMLDANPRERES